MKTSTYAIWMIGGIVGSVFSLAIGMSAWGSMALMAILTMVWALTPETRE